MFNLTARLLFLAALAALVQGGTYLARQGLQPPSVRLPEPDLRQMPYDLPREDPVWRGRELNDKEKDPRVSAWLAEETDYVLDRIYTKERRNAVVLHAAVFPHYDLGVFHLPTNCFRSGGWQSIKDTTLELKTGDEATVSVSLSIWEKEGERIMVVYWYQLDDMVILDRMQLGQARMKLWGRETWPALVKVLLQTPVTEEEQSESRMKSIAEEVYRWMNPPAARPAETASK